MMLSVNAELIERAREGDREAFREIYEQTSAFVYNTAFRILGSKEDAQEVVSDVFVSMFRKLNTFRGDAKLTTWLYRIAVNLALNRVKSNKARYREVPYEENMDVSQEPGADQALIAAEAKDRVEQLLCALPPDLKACAVLRDIEGLSYEEISAVLNVNLNTVRTRILRARRQMAVLVQGGVL